MNISISGFCRRFPVPTWRTYRRVKTLCAALIVCGVGFPAASAAVTPAQQAQIAKVFHDLNTSTPGCVAGVVHNDDLTYAHGFGMADIGQHVRMTPDTVLEIGSLSKQFTAAAILLLAQEGKLSLHDPVRKYLSGFPEYARPVTIGELVHHTSGIRDVIRLMTASGIRVADAATQQDAVAMIYRQRHLNFPPGTEYEYSNSGYVLLAEIVEKVSGEPFAKFLEDRIFRPLKMTRSYVSVSPFAVGDNHSRSYAKRRGGGYRLADSHWVQVGDGAVTTTVGDFARWMRNYERPVVGGESLIEALETPGRLPGGHAIRYAGGLVIDHFRGLLRVSHTGSWQGFRTAFALFPERHLGLVVLCNGSRTDPQARREKIAEILLRGTFPKPANDDGESQSEASLATHLRRYRGFYSSGDHRQLWRVKVGKGQAEMGPARDLIDSWRMGEAADSFMGEGMTVHFTQEDGQPARMRLEPAGTVLVRHGSLDQAGGVSNAEYKALTGSYRSRALQVTWRIDSKGGKLYLHQYGANPNRLDTNKRYQLKPMAQDVFQAGSYRLEFGQGQFWLFAGRASGIHFVRQD